MLFLLVVLGGGLPLFKTFYVKAVPTRHTSPHCLVIAVFMVVAAKQILQTNGAFLSLLLL